MRRLAVALVLVLGGSAFAAEPLVVPPGKRLQPLRRESPLTRQLPLFWDELNAQRVNEGILGRKNATRDEQRVAETPSLQPRPLSSW